MASISRITRTHRAKRSVQNPLEAIDRAVYGEVEGQKVAINLPTILRPLSTPSQTSPRNATLLPLTVSNSANQVHSTRLRGLLCPQQRRGDHVHHVAIGEMRGDCPGLADADVGQPEAG